MFTTVTLTTDLYIFSEFAISIGRASAGRRLLKAGTVVQMEVGSGDLWAVVPEGADPATTTHWFAFKKHAFEATKSPTILDEFCAMFGVTVLSHHDSDEGSRYYDFAHNGTHVLTVSASEIPEFMDRATGHLMPYGMMNNGNPGATEKHFAEFTDRYYTR